MATVTKPKPKHPFRSYADLRAEGARQGAQAERERAAAKQARPVPADARVVQKTAQVASAPSRRSYIAAIVVTSVILFVSLFRAGSKLSTTQKRSAVFSIAILMLTVAAVGEFAPGIATGFSVLLLISVLFGGTNVIQYVFVTIPGNLTGKAA
ncbi:MAG TPA: hypothetical protein VFG23_12330 [Polyangia bacterium]|nr:hypothetical protein [Polyangia bacterium]